MENTSLIICKKIKHKTDCGRHVHNVRNPLQMLISERSSSVKASLNSNCGPKEFVPLSKFNILVGALIAKILLKVLMKELLFIDAGMSRLISGNAKYLTNIS